jgi:hypothetical protein
MVTPRWSPQDCKPHEFWGCRKRKAGDTAGAGHLSAPGDSSLQIYKWRAAPRFRNSRRSMQSFSIHTKQLIG